MQGVDRVKTVKCVLVALMLIVAGLPKMRRSRDEIGSLTASFNRMRRSLQNAMRMLETEG